MTDDSEVARIAVQLSDRQIDAILAARWHGSGETHFATVDFVDPWPEGVAQFFKLHTDRLTPLGLRVRSYLQSKGGEVC